MKRQPALYFKFSVFIVLITSWGVSRAQTKHPPPAAKTNEVFLMVDINAEFPGGMIELGKFLSKTIKYPESTKQANIKGKVLLSFVVEKDGILTDFKVEKSLRADLDAEAIRVLKLSPKWIPAKLTGRRVRQLYELPVQFQISNQLIK